MTQVLYDMWIKPYYSDIYFGKCFLRLDTDKNKYYTHKIDIKKESNLTNFYFGALISQRACDT